MAMKTTTTTTHKTKATAAVAAAWQQRSIGVCSTAAVAVCHQRGSGGQQRGGNVPLFITHDEYFVRCGGRGGAGGTTMFLISPAMNFLVD